MKDWKAIPEDEIIEKTIKNLSERGFTSEVVNSQKDALNRLLTLIPEGGEVMTGSSTTLVQIGFLDFLNSKENKFNNLAKNIWAENDNEKRTVLRRKSESADYFVASVNAITEEGQLVAVDLSGSRVGAFPFAAGHLILVVSASKITKDLNTAMERIKEYVFPLENDRAQKSYHMDSGFGKWVIMEKEIQPGRVNVIIVKENLGF